MQWKKTMTKEETIKKINTIQDIELREFVMLTYDLGRRHEREECAKTAENISSYDRDEPEVSIAKAIRARKQDA